MTTAKGTGSGRWLDETPRRSRYVDVSKRRAVGANIVPVPRPWTRQHSSNALNRHYRHHRHLLGRSSLFPLIVSSFVSRIGNCLTSNGWNGLGNTRGGRLGSSKHCFEGPCKRLSTVPLPCLRSKSSTVLSTSFSTAYSTTWLTSQRS